MFGGRDIDELVEYVLAELLANDAGVETVSLALVGKMAADHPGAPALVPVLPLSMAAAAIEGMLAEPRAQGLAELSWRMSALIATEVLALQIELGPRADLAALQDRLSRDPEALGAMTRIDQPAAAARTVDTVRG